MAWIISFNSTRCIRNGDEYSGIIVIINLSTPHGALGTHKNLQKSVSIGLLSTPHGALGTKSDSIANTGYSGLSTPHGALGTEKADISLLRFSRFFQLHTVH